VITPRQYQVDFVERAIIGFEQRGYRKQLGVMGTGGGKTVCFSMLADYALKNWGKAPILILIDVSVESLIEQTLSAVFNVCGRYAEVLQGDKRPSAGAEIIVATMQTMIRRLDQYPPDTFQLVIVDEADRSVSQDWQKTLNHFDDFAVVCGVTATPDRTDKLNVMDYYEHVFDDVPMFALIGMGYLVRVKVRTAPVRIDLRQVKIKKGDFDERQVAEIIEPVFGDICAAIQEFAPDRKNVVFHPLRATSKKFVDIALDHGLNAAHIDGESPNRKALRQRFRDGSIQLMSNALLLSRGFDEPSISCITVLRPTKSPSLYRQFVGRGTRLFCPHGCNQFCEHPEAKRDLLLLDFLYQYEKHGLQTPASLLTNNERVNRALMTKFQQAGLPLDLQETSEEVKAAVEADIIAEIKKHAGKTGRFFDAVELSEVAQRIDLQRYQPTEEWERRPYTAAHAEALAGIGIDIRTVQNTGHAEAILKVAAAREAQGLCSFKQMSLLKRLGYDRLATMSKKQASKFCMLFFTRGYRPGWKKTPADMAERGFSQIKQAISQGVFENI
jgi:superfamily II DNA or RNA helicase